MQWNFEGELKENKERVITQVEPSIHITEGSEEASFIATKDSETGKLHLDLRIPNGGSGGGGSGGGVPIYQGAAAANKILIVSPNGYAEFKYADDKLDAESVRPVQNKVIQEALSKIDTSIGDLRVDDALSDVSPRAVQNQVITKELKKIKESIGTSSEKVEVDLKEIRERIETVDKRIDTTKTELIEYIDKGDKELQDQIDIINEDIDKIKEEIEDLKKRFPNLFADYNKVPLEISQSEVKIASIFCRTSKEDIDVEGHFRMGFVTSEDCVLTLRFKDNKNTEIFAPVQYDLHRGRNTVSVSLLFLKRLMGLHAFTVTAQVTHGVATVPIRSMLFYIHGSYVMSPYLDMNTNIRDYTLRQLDQTLGVDEMWFVSVDDGEVLVSRQPYGAFSETYELLYDIGEGIEAAIEFDGSWVSKEEDAKTTLVTNEKPWVFFINNGGELKAVNLEDESLAEVSIDSGVSSLSVVRGYQSKAKGHENQDQGIVIAYIKDGKPMYAQYRYEAALSKNVWDTNNELLVDEEELSNAISIGVARTNDFRLMFTVTTNNATYCIITERTYVNQAVKPEKVIFNTTEKDFNQSSIGIVPVGQENSFSASPIIPEDPTIPTNTFKVNFPYNLYYGPDAIDDLASKVRVLVNGTKVDIHSVTFEKNILTVKTEDIIECQKYADTDVKIYIDTKLLKIQHTNNSLHYRVDDYYKFTVVRPVTKINLDLTDEAKIDMNGDIFTSKIIYKPLLKLNVKEKEENNVNINDINLKSTIIYKPINQLRNTEKDIVNCDISSITLIDNIVYSYVGDKPI